MTLESMVLGGFKTNCELNGIFWKLVAIRGKQIVRMKNVVPYSIQRMSPSNHDQVLVLFYRTYGPTL